jgi:hypothetical protein
MSSSTTTILSLAQLRITQIQTCFGCQTATMSSSTTSMLELEQDTRPIHTTDKTKKRVTFAAENKNLTSIHEIPHLLDYSEEHIDELFYTEHELSYFRRDAQREHDHFVRQKAHDDLMKARARTQRVGKFTATITATKRKNLWGGQQQRNKFLPRAPSEKPHQKKKTSRVAQAA